MKAEGKVFKFGDNVDTDVIIPARYLNSSDPAELAKHCMEDIDKDFVSKVSKGDIIVANMSAAICVPFSFFYDCPFFEMKKTRLI